MNRDKVLKFLDGLKIHYDLREHPAVVDEESALALDEILPTNPSKNLFLVNRQQTEFYILMMPRHKDFRTKYLKQQLGLSHLSFASAEQMNTMLDVYPGSVSIMCLLNESAKNVHLILDDDVTGGETVRFHAGDNTASVRVSTDDFVNIILPALGHEPEYIHIPEQDLTA